MVSGRTENVPSPELYGSFFSIDKIHRLVFPCLMLSCFILPVVPGLLANHNNGRTCGKYGFYSHITPAIMDTYGEYKALLSKTGNMLDDMDLLIASTAIAHNLILVTNNDEYHFGRIKELERDNWST